MLSSSVISQFVNILGETAVITDKSEQVSYVNDWLGKWAGVASVVLKPATVQQVSDIMKICFAEGLAVVPQGGNTGMSGGATPDGSGSQVIVSLTRMNKVRNVDLVNNTITVDAGVVLAEIQNACRAKGRFFPLSLGAEGSCTIGGNLATNAGGTAVLRYGNTRDLTLGIEVVLPDGQIWDGLTALRKNNTGYDLKNLFIGSEGSLGLITGAVLKLYPDKPFRACAWVAVNSFDAILMLLEKFRGVCGDKLNAFEMMTADCIRLISDKLPNVSIPLPLDYAYYILIEISDENSNSIGDLMTDVLDKAFEKGQVLDAALSVSEQQRLDFWKVRESISEAQVKAGKVIKHDIALPISQLKEFCAAAGQAIAQQLPEAEVINFGHIGDGNLHYNLLFRQMTPQQYTDRTLQANRLVHDLVVQMHGAISAEHGVGQLRRDELAHYKAPVEMELMRAIKMVIDKKNIMNPGKLL